MVGVFTPEKRANATNRGFPLRCLLSIGQDTTAVAIDTHLSLALMQDFWGALAFLSASQVPDILHLGGLGELFLLL